MKLVLFVLINIAFVSTAFAQQINKAKIEDITAYIKKADHPLIVNFWATWCKPCIEELPLLQQTAQQNKSSKVELIMVSLDFPEAYPNDILDFINKKNINATFFWLDETDADHFCPAIDKQWQGSIPATLIINKKNSYRKFFEKKIGSKELHVAVKTMLQ
ncbi:MAG TPA: TlpA disulfide reductase family protein [Chitinophagaceae bacterium]|nr:TlpA disulfide reductase family protein [Chitinophagaceae bacterium]